MKDHCDQVILKPCNNYDQDLQENAYFYVFFFFKNRFYENFKVLSFVISKIYRNGLNKNLINIKKIEKIN